MEKLCLNVREVAELLGVSTAAVYTLAASKGFPSIKISKRRIVIPAEAFRRWLDRASNTETDNGR